MRMLVCGIVLVLMAAVAEAGNYTITLTPDQEVALATLNPRGKEPTTIRSPAGALQGIIDARLAGKVEQLKAQRQKDARAAACAKMKVSPAPGERAAAATLCD